MLFPHTLAFFVEPTDVISIGSLIQQFGFPTVLSLALLWFCYQVYKDMARQVRDKDKIISAQIEHDKKFSADIVKTQDDIVRAQSEVTEILGELKSLFLTTK